ncbi:MAG: hypothetical protein AAFZ63_26765 [Bacteroidota bacterium]
MRNVLLTLLCILTISSTVLSAQSTITRYDLEEGQVLDILLLRQQPDTDDLLSDYFKTAFPVAKRFGYRPMAGHKVTKITQGNHMPFSFVFGKWEDLNRREDFIEEATDEIPDFHERRRNIWSYFGLTYYKMEEDLSFAIDSERFNVVTAYWQKPNASISTFHHQWVALAQTEGSDLILELSNGKSPFGYYHQPTYLTITSWENEAAFSAFLAKCSDLALEGVQHLNQFIIN